MAKDLKYIKSDFRDFSISLSRCEYKKMAKFDEIANNFFLVFRLFVRASMVFKV